MAIIGGLLILVGFALFVAALVAMFKPLPKLRMATRKAAAVGMALSVASCLVGSGISPRTETEPVATAEVDGEVEPAEPVTGYEMSGEQLLERMNSVWAEHGRAGAFAVRTSEEVKAGENKGGWTTNACASSEVCALIEESPDRLVTAVILLMGGDGTHLDALELMNYQLGVIRIFEPDTDIADAFQRQMDALGSEEPADAEEIGRSCLSIIAPAGMGIWTTISRSPCD